MESFKNFLTVAFPQYLSKLPLPDDFQGFLTLSQEEWLSVVAFVCLRVYFELFINVCQVVPNVQIIGEIYQIQK